MYVAVLELDCQRGLSAHPVCSSTDLLHLLEHRLRCPGIDPSAAFETLLEQSMALDESHVILGKLPPFPDASLCCVGSALIRRPARLSRAHAPGLGAPGNR